MVPPSISSLSSLPDDTSLLPFDMTTSFLAEHSCHRDPIAMTTRYSNAWSALLNRCLKERDAWTRAGFQAHPKGKQLTHGPRGDRQSSYRSDCVGVRFSWSFRVIRVNSFSLRIVSEATLSVSKKGGETGSLDHMAPLRSGQYALPASPQRKEGTTPQDV
jgi:hypothetical protein